ncbi:DUF2125 domain-containing protein [Psychromarinibacter sp. C21-152]|uniref:DUF2125 domain-containing protein n=1 Tax=Psychromarinibacter sediminicola TaxID=3033385 RepID=A0AAE3NMN6_9RHOB|nr:DUF2125 domain-containing protein [Psychromarinibacter sediminicola]MDF0600708.1 DUF2125 domain-containing protein [Psychromarinibacter sediminicola]
MKHCKTLCATAALFVAFGGPASADVTSAEVWEAWQSAAEEMGQTFTAGSESQDGGTLTVTDLQFGMETTDASASGTIPEIVFTEQGDGTVAIDMSPSYDMTVTVAPEGAEEVEVGVNIATDGLDMVASGTPDAVSYDYVAAGMTASVTELVVDGESLELDTTVELSDLAGSYTVGGDSDMASQFTAASMVLMLHMDEPDGGDGTVDATFDFADLSVKSDGSLAMMAGGVKELAAALGEGMSSQTSVSHGAATYLVDFQDGSDMFHLDGSTDSGLLEIALSADSFSYDIGNTGLDFTVSGSEIPLPQVAVQMGEFGFGLMLPPSASEEPQDFSFGLTMADLSIDEQIWGMIDPQGQLPHDPATLILDVAGQANFLFDLFDPESAGMVEADMPAEIHALDIEELRLAAVGTELTGGGSFTFDMDDMETFDGVPAPTGTLNLRLTGANALLDTLVSMNLLPEDQAMGARMMMGLFARPGDGEDVLVSEIEIDGATGAITANGQRIQ